MAPRSSRASKNRFPRSPAVDPLADLLLAFNLAGRGHGYGSHNRHRDPSPMYLYEEQQKYSGRTAWERRENEKGLYLRFDMPGVGRESITVRLEGDKLVMKGQGEKDFVDREFGPAYDYNVQLHDLDLYDTKAMKVDMVNGVLKVFVPKL